MAKRGRPAFKPTPSKRRIVEEMVSCGESKELVARALGIDSDTLQKHFAEELLNGRSKRRREVIGLLYRAARKGNVSAQKKLEDMTGMSTDPAPPKPAVEKPAPALGKKEEAAQAAQEAPAEGSRWSGLLN